MLRGERRAAEGDVMKSDSGDAEAIVLEPSDRAASTTWGRTHPCGDAKPGDGVLQVVGGTSVEVDYAGREYGVRRPTAAASFDRPDGVHRVRRLHGGAYREYTQRRVRRRRLLHPRSRTWTATITPRPDKDRIRVRRSRVQGEEGCGERARTGGGRGRGRGFRRGGVKVGVRDQSRRTLSRAASTAASSSAAAGPGSPRRAKSPGRRDAVGGAGRTIVMEYDDESTSPARTEDLVRAEARLLIGAIQDVKIEHREVESLEVKARKKPDRGEDLPQAGLDFQGVGLEHRGLREGRRGAGARGGGHPHEHEGQPGPRDRGGGVQHQVGTPARQGKLRGGHRRVPHADAAVPRTRRSSTRRSCEIGLAKMDPGSRQVDESVSIFNAVLRLNKSNLKAEAAYRIAEVYERRAQAAAKQSGREPDLSYAMLAYKTCAETYPDSSLAETRSTRSSISTSKTATMRGPSS